MCELTYRVVVTWPDDHFDIVDVAADNEAVALERTAATYGREVRVRLASGEEYEVAWHLTNSN